MVVILLGVQYYVTRTIVEHAKEVKVKSDHVLRDEESGAAVATEEPHTYVTNDLPQLPKEALDSIQSVSFITEEDGLAHRYRVAGYRFNEYEPERHGGVLSSQWLLGHHGEDESILASQEIRPIRTVGTPSQAHQRNSSETLGEAPSAPPPRDPGLGPDGSVPRAWRLPAHERRNLRTPQPGRHVGGRWYGGHHASIPRGDYSATRDLRRNEYGRDDLRHFRER